jgi:beta-carotene hydroxylase
MSDKAMTFDHLTPEQKAHFKSLTSAPRIAWITVAMWIGLNVAFFTSDYFGATARMSLWVGMLLNSFVGYVAFSVVHDSVHRAVSASVVGQ